MPAVKRYGKGWVVVNTVTGQPLTEQVFKSRSRALQAANELYRGGSFY